MQERVRGRPEEAVGGTGGEREGERAQGGDGAAETQGDILGAVCSPLLGGRAQLGERRHPGTLWTFQLSLFLCQADFLYFQWIRLTYELSVRDIGWIFSGCG